MLSTAGGAFDLAYILTFFSFSVSFIFLDRDVMI